MATRIQKMKWDLHCKKEKMLLIYGLKNGLITLYDDELIEKLRNIYYGGIPASIILLSNVKQNDQVKKELFSDLIYVYTTKGEIIELPKNSTPIDFAYKIHTDIGNNMVAAFVNDNYVSIDYKLQNKDRVRIITNELSDGPREDWIDKAHTTLAKRKIKEFNKNIKS